MRGQQVYTTRRADNCTMRRVGNYTARRMGNYTERQYAEQRGGSARSFARNYNTVRHAPKTLGSVSNAAIVGLLVLIVGLIYVAQGTQATNYDYQLSELDSEIAELVAKKEDLAVERARLTSIAASENSEVATTMETAKVGGYAEE